MPRNLLVDLRRKQIHQYKEPARYDPYHGGRTLKGSPQCSVCGAVHLKGKWIKSRIIPKNILNKKMKCNACRQLNDHYALGVVELHFDEKSNLNRSEILRTLKRTEKVARNRNDQERILWMSESTASIKVYVTLPTLAHHMGRELNKTYKGKTEYLSTNEDTFLRVKWRNEEEPCIDGLEKEDFRSKAFRGRGRH